MSYLRPETLEAALEARAQGGVQVIAGGTDVYPARAHGRSWGDYQRAPMLDISRLAELRGITKTGGHWRIGALTSWSEIINAPLPPAFDGLKLAAREVGGVQIQNRGTIAGNLCNASPAADGVPPLLALDAEVEIAGANGTRCVALAEFIDGYRHTVLEDNELVTAILVPRLAETARSHFLKLGARRYLVISIAMVAATIANDDTGTITQARIAIGACSEVAQRLAALEADLTGRSATARLGDIVEPRHVETLEPVDDIRADAAYRRDAAHTLTADLLNALGAQFEESA